MSTSAVTPPPGFELERGEHLAVTPPPGFELEDQASKHSVQLPPGFELESQTSKDSIQLPPGFELEQPNLSPSPSRPKTTSRITQAHPVAGARRPSSSDLDAATLKFFNDALAKFSDSSEMPTQAGSGNAGASFRGNGNAQPDQPNPSAFSRFTNSAGQAMGVPPRMSDYLEGPKIAITHPIESAKLLKDAAIEAQQSVVDKAYFYQHQPGFANKAKGVVYGIYSAIPFVGPSLAHAGEQFENRDFAGGLGTMTGVVVPSVIGGKGGGFREPSFRLGPSFRTGDTVLLPNGQVGTIQGAFPAIGAVSVQTQQGLRTVRVRELAKVEEPVPGIGTNPTLSTHPPTTQIKTGDVVPLANGRSGTVEEIFPRFGAARVRTAGGRTRTVKLEELEQQARKQSLQSSLNYSPHPIQKPRSSAAQSKSWSDSLPKQSPRGKGAARDFQIKHCGQKEILMPAGDEQLWVDGFDADRSFALESKYVEKPGISPYIPSSRMPSHIRQKIHSETVDEFRRYSLLIADPKTPVIGLEVITNDRGAVPYFLDLMRQYRVPGRIVVK